MSSRDSDEAVIQNLLATLQNVSPEARERVINCLSAQSKSHRSAREALWNYQLGVLCEKKVPQLVGMPEDKFLGYCEPLKAKFLSAAGEHDCLVLPPTFLTPAQKMTLVVVDGARGWSYPNPALLYPADGAKKRPDSPYLMLDVEDGRKMLKMPPDDCFKQFANQKRLGFTADEGAMLCVYWPETLRHHYIDCPGSRYDRGDVPCVSIWYGEPWLDACYSDDGSPSFGSASCGSIFVP